MKRTDLEKLKGLKIANEMKRAPYAAGTHGLDRRARRRQDQARGLIPFAVKLDGELVKRLRERAQARSLDLNALVDELLRQGLQEPK